LVIDLVKDALGNMDSYLFDGFPRTIDQAKALDKITDIDAVLYLDIKQEVLIDRISGRRVCRSCSGTYHTEFIGDAKTCAACSGELFQRDDDNFETVKSRLSVFNAQTKPLIEYYQTQGKLKNIKCGDFPHETFANVTAVLDTL
jgi:adenylate kinase